MIGGGSEIIAGGGVAFYNMPLLADLKNRLSGAGAIEMMRCKVLMDRILIFNRLTAVKRIFGWPDKCLDKCRSKS
jgi:hypothetical protein